MPRLFTSVTKPVQGHLHPFCEYIFCKSDILLYHLQKVESESPVALDTSFQDLTLNDEGTYDITG